MKFLLAKKALQFLPRVVIGIAALIMLVVMGAGAGLGAVLAFAAPSTPPSSVGVNLQGWTHPLGGAHIWDTYASSSHLLGAVDLPASAGTSVFAAADGVIVHAGWQGTYGLSVTIEHAGGDGTHYAHLSSLLTSVGARVEAGQAIGLVGSTGGDWGAHLHFETRQGSTNRSSGVPAYSYMLVRGIDLGHCYGGPCYVAGG